MSTTTSPATLQRSARQPGRLRTLRLVLGSLGVLAAIAFVGAGSVLSWALETHRDSSGYFTTATHRYRTSAYALSTETLDVSGATGALEDRLARIRVAATSTDAAKPLFVGIARSEDAERYLARVEHDELRDIEFDPFRIAYLHLGAGAPTSPPAAQSFWQARALGTGTQTISWPVQKGRWSAVVMNADGSRNVAVDAQVAARLAGAWWFVAASIALGALSLVGGLALVRAGARRPADAR